MARKKSSPAEDIIELVSMLPWWLGLVLALVSYVVLHALALRPAMPVTGTSQIGQAVTHGIGTSLAQVGQYLLPLLCVLGSIVSFVRRKKRESLVSHAVERGAQAVDGMSWHDFELLIGEAFRLQGYQVREIGGPAPDGGVDLQLQKGTESFLVQCKQWRARQVGVQVVREFYGVMAQRGAAGGFVVTSGTFTDDAIAFVQGTNLRLVDGTKLAGLLQQAKRLGHIAPVSPATAQSPAVGAATRTPECPVCRAPMQRRIARKGANAGADFWGCTRFPTCRGTRPT